MFLDVCPTKDWSKTEFAPEKAFLADAEKVSGVTAIETQTMTSEALFQQKHQELQLDTQPNSKIEFNHVSR